MINLLPQSEKKALVREYRLRFGIVILVGIFTLEVLGMFLLVPAYYELFLSTRGLTQNLAQLRALTPEGVKDARQSITAIEKAINALKISNGAADIPPSSLFQEIVLQKPQGIEFYALSYARTQSGASMRLSGIALTQEDLLAFRRNVKTNSRVLDFKYGSSFITQKTNIDFTATVTF